MKRQKNVQVQVQCSCKKYCKNWNSWFKNISSTYSSTVLSYRYELFRLKVIFFFHFLYFNLLHRVQLLSSGGSGNLLVHQFFCCWHCNMSYCIDNTIKGMELLFQFFIIPVFSLFIKNFHFIDSITSPFASLS